MFREILECWEVPVWSWGGCILRLQRGCIVNEADGVGWDGDGLHSDEIKYYY